MSDFDPFGGGSSSGDYSGYTTKKSKNSAMQLVKKIIPWIIILTIIGIGVKFLFFNNATVMFTVNNTEGEEISDASIVFAKDQTMRKVVEKFYPGDEITLKKGKYYYKIVAEGYNLKSVEPIEVKSNIDEMVTLEKNIKLKINGFTFPENVFIGQQVISLIEVSNTSPSEYYDSDNISFKGDIENWEYEYIDKDGLSVSLDSIRFEPQKTTNIYVKFRTPTDIKKKKSYSANITVKYRKESSKNEKEFFIIEEPNLSISFKNTKETIESGQTHDITYEINNKKNDVSINDIEININIEGVENENVISWFDAPSDDIFVDKKKTKTGIITVNVPITAVNENLKGTITVNSISVFSEPKIYDIDLTIKEPNIDFEVKSSKDKIDLDYDINTNLTNEEYVTLTLENNNEFAMNISSINLEYSSGIDDCNNLITIPQNYIVRMAPQDSQELFLNVSAIDPNQIQSQLNENQLLVNNSRVCTIKVKYEDPFREGNFLEKSVNLMIFIEAKS